MSENNGSKHPVFSVAGVAIIAVLALILGMLLGGRAIVNEEHQRGTDKQPGLGLTSQLIQRPVHRVMPLSPTQFLVGPGSMYYWNLTVIPGMRNFQLQGSFSVSGGRGNDIICGVMDRAQFQNWAKGHVAAGYYFSPGQVTTGEINLRLSPGSYVLAFSNRFSAFSQKLVTQGIVESFDQAQWAKDLCARNHPGVAVWRRGAQALLAGDLDLTYAPLRAFVSEFSGLKFCADGL
jgi:hypothetical protein